MQIIMHMYKRRSSTASREHSNFQKCQWELCYPEHNKCSFTEYLWPLLGQTSRTWTQSERCPTTQCCKHKSER